MQPSIRSLTLVLSLGILLIPTLLLNAQNRDLRAERLVLDDNNGNTLILQTPPGPITGGTLTIPDPAGSGQFLISNPAGGSQSISGDLLPGADDMYDLGSAAMRWQDIFAAGLFSLGGQLQFVETGGGTDYVGFQAPAAVAASQVWTLPAADGANGEVLTTDGLGMLSWAAGGASGAAGGDLTGTYPNPTIANDAVTTAKIQDGQVQNGDISVNAITTSKVANGTVTTSKMADSAISGLKLLTFAVTNRHLAANAVTPDKVSPTGAASGDVLTYNGANVVWGAPTLPPVTGAMILDSTITTADISPSAAIPYSKLSLVNSIQNFDIVANAITTSKVANGTVTTSKMADSAISGLKLLTFAVNNRHLAAGAVTTDKVSPTGAASGDVITYDGTNVVWSAPTAGTVTHNATLTGDGTGPSPLGINLGNPNSWSGAQTFSSVDVNGGTIDGTAIGGASASTGAFTTVTTTGSVTVNDGVNADLVITEGGFDRSSAGTEVIRLNNSGAGTVDVLINGATQTTNSRLTVNEGHWTSEQATAPTGAGTLSFTGVGASVTVTGTDVAGTVDAVSSGTTANSTFTVTFNRAYGTPPIVGVTPANANAYNAGYYVSATSTTTFTVTLFAPATGSHVYNYHVIEVQ